MKPLIGYCAVTADYLHIGHIEFINACAAECQRLIVGVMTDKYIRTYKKRKPLMNQNQRKKLVENIRAVYRVELQDEYEFPHSILRLKEFYKEQGFVIFDSDEHARENADIIIPGGSKRKEKQSSTLFRNAHTRNS